MENAQYRIEAAQAVDVPALVGLLESLFSLEQDFTPAADKQQRALQRLLAVPEHARIMVARDASGNAIGMVSGQLVISTAEGAYSLWVEDVVIAAAHQGRGLGRRLLAALLDWARAQGATRAQLLADLDNQPAKDFYAHLGWHETRLGAYRRVL